MNFPNFFMPYAGNGMTIGGDAVLHVLISHGVAIGLFAMIVLGDWYDLTTRLRDTESWSKHNKRLLKFAAITAAIVGAVTGAGIWFTVSGLAPRGIAAILRVFFWAWFFEWIVFCLEVFAILGVYFLWKRLEERRKLRILLGILYVVLAWLSMVFITGILGFMLTSGAWPTTKLFWDAYLNPSYIPQLAFRMSIAACWGSLLALGFTLLGRYEEGFRKKAMRLYGSVLAIGAVCALIAGTWYVIVVPTAYLERTIFSVMTSRLTGTPEIFFIANGVGLAIIALTALTVLAGQGRLGRLLILPAMICMIGFVAEFERIREFIRGPYLMPGYMYVNGTLIAEEPLRAEEGALARSYWFDVTHRPNEVDVDSAGAFLWANQCTGCHTVDGVNGIRARVRGRSERGIYVMLGHTHEMVDFMPPLSGNDQERRAVARFLYQMGNEDLPLRSNARVLLDRGDNRSE